MWRERTTCMSAKLLHMHPRSVLSSAITFHTHLSSLGLLPFVALLSNTGCLVESLRVLSGPGRSGQSALQPQFITAAFVEGRL